MTFPADIHDRDQERVFPTEKQFVIYYQVSSVDTPSLTLIGQTCTHVQLNATLYGRKEKCCPTQVQGLGI
jgi:hypothetical protein